MKKLLSLFLAIASLLSMAVPAMAAEVTDVEGTVVVEATAETEPAEIAATEVTETAAAVQAATTGKCGENMTWAFDAATGTLTISGTGDMYTVVNKWQDFNAGTYAYEPEWWSLPVKHVVVEEGVENLSDFAFAQSAKGNEGVFETIQLPKTLKAIPQYGFIISTAMKELHIPEGIKSLTGWPFGNPDNSFMTLTDLYLPASLEKMDICTVYYSGYSFQTGSTLKYIHYAGTESQWTEIERDQSAPLGGLMTGYNNTKMEELFAALTVLCADQDSEDPDNEIVFDDLLFSLSDGDKIVAEPVTYNAGEQPAVMPKLTVVYSDGTTGTIPENVSIQYPTEWPTEPGVYELTILVADRYEAIVTVTVLALIDPNIPTERLAAPAVKVGLDASGNNALVWDAVEYADCYDIYVATSKTGKYSLTATVDQTVWTHTAATVGKTYYYKVVAVYEADADLSSSYSDVVSITAKCLTTTLKVAANSSGKPVLTWNKVTGAKKYEIYRSVNGAAFKKLTTITKLTYTDSKATSGAKCTYKVKVLGSKTAYNSNYSLEQSCYVTCAAPSLTVKLDSTTGKPTLSWSKVTGAASYDIYRAVNGGAYELVKNTTGTSYKDTDVPADNKYSYKMVTVGKEAVFNSTMSAAKTVTVLIPKAKLTGTTNDNGKPVITWNAVEGAKEYKVYRSTKSNKGFSLVKTTTDLSYTDTTVAAGKTYYYKVLVKGQNSENYSSSAPNCSYYYKQSWSPEP